MAAQNSLSPVAQPLMMQRFRLILEVRAALTRWAAHLPSRHLQGQMADLIVLALRTVAHPQQSRVERQKYPQLLWHSREQTLQPWEP